MCLTTLLLFIEIISLDYFLQYVYGEITKVMKITQLYSIHIKEEVSLLLLRLYVINDFHLYLFPNHRHDSDYLYIEMLLGKFPSVDSNPIPPQEQSISFSLLTFKTFLWTKVTQGYMTEGFSIAVISHGR